jgi:hypothetical protein
LKRARLFWAVALFAALSTAAWGQLITASIEGIVLDPTGAAVPSAKVRAVNTSTGLEVHREAAADGRYSFPSLPPGGPYSVAVEAAGFNTEERSGLTLQVNQALRLDFTLKIGSTTEVLVVTGEAPLVESTSASMGQVVTSQSIVNLPLNQRNAYSLVFLAPGVQGGVNFTYNSANFSVNGGRPGSTDILVDGIPSSPALANPIEGIAVFPSVDAVQEFKVQTNMYSAEFGRSGSGIINLIYKSGTNSFHGSAFEFLRNSDLDSNNYYSNASGLPLASFKRSQFGGSLGGPVEIPKLYHGKDKTFFFVAYEGLRQGTASNFKNTVPTLLQRTGDFSQTYNSAGKLVTIYDPTTTVAQGTGYVRSPFPGNVIPANRIDPVAKNVLNYYPLPNNPGLPFSQVDNYFVATSSVQNSNSIDTKVDENLNDRNRFFVRYSRMGLDQPARKNLFPSAIAVADGEDNNAQTNNSAAIDYTLTLSATNLLGFRYGFARIKLNYNSVSLGFNPTTLGLPSYIAANADHLLFPGFAPAGYFAIGNPGQGETRSPGFDSHILAVENTRIFGAHTLRFGVEGRLMRSNDTESGSSTGNFSFAAALTQGPSPNTASNTAGNGLATMLLGGGSGSMIIASKDCATQSYYYGAFLQDDWKVSRRLTLNLGLRYDLDIPRTERYNRMETFNPTIPSPVLAAQTGIAGLSGGTIFVGVNGASRRQFDPQYRNFDPRFGFAYQATAKTVIRGGYGIFYAPSLRTANATIGSQGFSATTNYNSSPNGLTQSFYLSNPFPTGLNHPVGSSQGLLTGLGSSFSNPLTGDNNVPYMENWDFNIQRQLPGNILIDAAYVGSHGVNLNKAGEGQWNLNQLTPANMALGSKLQQSVANPFSGIITTGPEASATIPQYYLMAPFPQFAAVQASFPTGGFSTYHAFQLKVEKRLTQGLTALLSFTGQKSIDDFSQISNVGNQAGGIQNIYDDRQQRAVSSNDRSRRLVISGTYQLPFGRGRAFGKSWSRPVDALIGGWQVNGIYSYQTGFPISVTAANNCTGCGIQTLRPNNNGKSAELSGPVSQRMNQYFDTSVFSQPTAFTFGSAPRTLPDVRGPSSENIDFSLFKTFKPIERLAAEFHAEAYNLLNQVGFGAPGAGINSNTFGMINSQANTPRQIQFALKLLF